MAKFKSSFVELDLHEAPLAGYTHGYLDSSGTESDHDLSLRRRLPFLTELSLGRKRTTIKKKSALFTNPAVAGNFPPVSSNDDAIQRQGLAGEEENVPNVIKTGFLSKTTVSGKDGSKIGQSRQRQFRLTEEALEYLHTFSQVKVKRSFPLTSIEKVEYSDSFEPTIFRLIFSKFIEILQAETEEDANDWVEKIREACAKWRPSFIREPSCDKSQRDSDDDERDPEEAKSDDTHKKTGIENEQQPLRERMKSDSKVHLDDEHLLAKHHFTRSRTISVGHRRRFTSPATLSGMHERYRQRQAKKKLRRASKATVDFSKNFSMIKYPRHGMFGVPGGKVFKLDPDNMQIMWRESRHSRFQISRTLSLHKVVEVREGQNTDMFDKFPYPKVEDQSFSLVYPKEDKKYTYLTSLNVICAQQSDCNLWVNELKSKVRGHQDSFTHPRLSSKDDDRTDTTLLWLKQMWSYKSENDELAERTAIKLAKKLNPFVTEPYAKRIVSYAHCHQVDASHGLSLDFSGFVLMYNLITEISENRLHSIFNEYAQTSPQLGLTVQEFREFLVNECCWTRRACTKSVLRKLMQSHDSYHQPYKKYCAKNKSSDFVAGQKLLSFAGFLSFLRSKDNSAIDPEHETVYQDMTQPLSHYFINSSHNTYLEGDQLRGKSSTDAYISTFLQGCRCVEIDCWNDSLNMHDGREPIIYHGYTLTTKLPFRNVIHTIKDYGISDSAYPLVISIENHCNRTNQTKMAKIFRAIFDEMLPDKDLVELEGRDRLPSPHELRGKIILKGSYKENKEEEVVKKPTRLHQMLRKVTSLSSPSSPTDSITISPLHSLPVKLTTLEVKSQYEEIEDSENEDTSSVKSDGDDASISSSREVDTVDDAQCAQPLDSDHEEEYLSKRHFSRQKSKSLKEICRLVVETEQGQDDQELVFNETLGDLRSLIIYAKSLSIKPWSWEKQRATSVTQMFSFGEPTAVELCTKWIKDMLACTERQLVRTYPKGTRFDSSNYDPMPMWRCGIQLVALNFQYPDIYMHLNQGFFRQNGGCGYILKPAIMRREDPGGGSTPFDPEMQAPHPDVPAVDFEIELLSGQRLCPWKKKRSSVMVNIHTYGIPHDSGHIIDATHGNTLWPHWGKGKHHLKKTLYMPELCLVYFRVKADTKLFGQNCIPVISLQPGLKFIPLRTPGGELIPGSGLFVKMKKATAATTEETPRESGEAKETPPLHMRKISRQDTIDLDGEDAEETKDDTLEDEREEESETEGGEDDSESRPDILRRFSSPASIECTTGLFFQDGSELTTIAEVYEDLKDS